VAARGKIIPRENNSKVSNPMKILIIVSEKGPGAICKVPLNSALVLLRITRDTRQII
jgi:hypothetical protein